MNNWPFWIQTPSGPRNDVAVGVSPGKTAVVKLVCPTTTSGGWFILTGMDFQMSTRLLLVSATTRGGPSKPPAGGVFMPVGVGVGGDDGRHAGVVGVVVTVTL